MNGAWSWLAEYAKVVRGQPEPVSIEKAQLIIDDLERQKNAVN
jgi:hypothetical protein